MISRRLMADMVTIAGRQSIDAAGKFRKAKWWRTMVSRFGLSHAEEAVRIAVARRDGKVVAVRRRRQHEVNEKYHSDPLLLFGGSAGRIEVYRAIRDRRSNNHVDINVSLP